MERLSIDEVIEHCNKTCDMTEKTIDIDLQIESINSAIRIYDQKEKELNKLAEIKKKKAEINSLIDKTKELRESLEVELKKFIIKNITDYKLLSVEEKQILGAFVNSVKALAALLNKKVA